MSYEYFVAGQKGVMFLSSLLGNYNNKCAYVPVVLDNVEERILQARVGLVGKLQSLTFFFRCTYMCVCTRVTYVMTLSTSNTLNTGLAFVYQLSICLYQLQSQPSSILFPSVVM